METAVGGPDGPIIMLAGERVALGPVERAISPLLNRWLNDPEVGLPWFYGTFVPEHQGATEERLDRWLKDERAVHFTIYERATGRPIGVTDLHGIHHTNRTAEFGIAIGVRELWGRGYGTEATRLILEHAFTALDLNSILLTVMSYNARAIRTYSRAGFREVGRWREAKRVNGYAYDIVYMDCLATDFRASLAGYHLSGLPTPPAS